VVENVLGPSSNLPSHPPSSDESALGQRMTRSEAKRRNHQQYRRPKRLLRPVGGFSNCSTVAITKSTVFSSYSCAVVRSHRLRVNTSTSELTGISISVSSAPVFRESPGRVDSSSAMSFVLFLEDDWVYDGSDVWPPYDFQ
jgi:hypothetical protein